MVHQQSKSSSKSSSIKRLNTKNILNVIRKKGPISRSEIAEVLDLTPATISNITSELIDKRLITEAECGDSSGGRKPIMLRIRTDYYRVIGIYIGSKKIKLIASDLMANTKYKKEFHYDNEDVTLEKIKAILIPEIREVIRKYQVKGKKVVGIGVGIHGLVDPVHGISIFAPNLHWKNVNIREEFESVFGIPVFVDNNTRTMGLGENWFGTGKNVSSFFCLNVEYGVGGSLFIDDKVFSGASFGAGEIGHTTVDMNGEKCSCGNVGCLETVASVKALEKFAFEGYSEHRDSMIFSGKEINSVRDIHSQDIFEAVKMGDSFAISLIRRIGKNLGVGIANVINIFNPELVIINGEIISTGEFLLEPIIAAVREKGFANSVNSTEIVLSKLGNVAYLKGAVVLATQHIFDNPELVGE